MHYFNECQHHMQLCVTILVDMDNT